MYLVKRLQLNKDIPGVEYGFIDDKNLRAWVFHPLAEGCTLDKEELDFMIARLDDTIKSGKNKILSAEEYDESL